MQLPYRLNSQQKISFLVLVALYAASWAMLFVGTWGIMPALDIPFHFFGGFFVARFFAGHVLAQPNAADFSRKRWVVIGLACIVGIAWELYELALTVWLGDYFAAQGIGPCCIGTLFDTGKDLVMDTLGAIVASYASLRSFTKKSG